MGGWVEQLFFMNGMNYWIDGWMDRTIDLMDGWMKQLIFMDGTTDWMD